MKRRRVLAQIAASAFGPGLCASSRSAQGHASPAAPVQVAAASDLKFALTQIASLFQAQTGQAVALRFGSSGQFARQIAYGLPVDLFMSADESYVFELAKAGLTRAPAGHAGAPDTDLARGTRYATGRIALLIAPGADIRLDANLNGLRASWQHVSKFALANPEHAPYGRAARQALVALGLWEMVQPKLVLGENIAQATHFVSSGAAQAGLTALSLALAPEVAQPDRHLALPERLHDPLHQRMVLLKSAGVAADALFRFLQMPAARALMARYGFSSP